MKKIIFGGLTVALLWLFCVNSAEATMIKVGTATYKATAYNLIYDDDLQITWLDYTNQQKSWQNQINWATELNNANVLTYNFIGYTPAWTDAWRLPSAGDNPLSGYNQTSSEIGHLFYTEMGLSGGPVSVSTLNSGVFDNLVSFGYWSGTEYVSNPDYAWGFSLTSGGQFITNKNFPSWFAMAVRPGQVSAGAPVPEPSTILLLGIGLAGLIGGGVLRRRK